MHSADAHLGAPALIDEAAIEARVALRLSDYQKRMDAAVRAARTEGTHQEETLRAQAVAREQTLAAEKEQLQLELDQTRTRAQVGDDGQPHSRGSKSKS